MPVPSLWNHKKHLEIVKLKSAWYFSNKYSRDPGILTSSSGQIGSFQTAHLPQSYTSYSNSNTRLHLSKQAYLQKLIKDDSFNLAQPENNLKTFIKYYIFVYFKSKCIKKLIYYYSRTRPSRDNEGHVVVIKGYLKLILFNYSLFSELRNRYTKIESINILINLTLTFYFVHHLISRLIKMSTYF